MTDTRTFQNATGAARFARGAPMRPARAGSVLRGLAATVLAVSVGVGFGACAEESDPPGPLGFLYVGSPASLGLLGQKVRSDNGKVVVDSSELYGTGTELDGLAISSDDAYLYAASGEDDSVSQYAIDTDKGGLSLVSPPLSASSATCRCIRWITR